MEVEVFLLASGESKRMGASKPLLKFGGESVIERVVNAFRESGYRDITVIGRTNDEDLKTETERLGIKYIENHQHKKGMSSSVEIAIDSCVSGWLCLFPVDIPLIKSEILAKFFLYNKTNAQVIQPVCDNRKRHPVWLNKSVFHEILLELQSGKTLREVLQAKQIHTIETQDCDQFMDFDTPEEYAELLSKAGFST